MSIQNIQSQIQSAEHYKIRAKSESQQAEEIQSQQIAQEVQPKTDEYDKANPVGEEVEGIYSVSHDEDGKLEINYKQPTSKSDSESQVKGAKSEAQNDKAGGVPAAAVNEDDDDEEDEIEKLKKQRDSIKQQLNKETEERVKSQLRAQLQAIEMQIALKSSE